LPWTSFKAFVDLIALNTARHVHAGNMMTPGFTGSLPAALTGAKQLLLLDLSDNNITGEDEGSGI
jgi:hypothetical protein